MTGLVFRKGRIGGAGIQEGKDSLAGNEEGKDRG